MQTCTAGEPRVLFLLQCFVRQENARYYQTVGTIANVHTFKARWRMRCRTTFQNDLLSCGSRVSICGAVRRGSAMPQSLGHPKSDTDMCM